MERKATTQTMRNTLLLLTAYSLAMALLEAAVVVYMRELYYPENPKELFPLHFLLSYDPRLELSREISTIVMIITVALLAERRNLTRKFAAFVFIFGVWDLFYYVWLKVLMDWPRTWLEWDVLFLIPMIWLGPWICPALIATLFMVWGTFALTTSREVAFSTASLSVFGVGAIIGLYSFMQPALGMEKSELVRYEPGYFAWWLFWLSFILMTIGLVRTIPNIPTEPKAS